MGRRARKKAIDVMVRYLLEAVKRRDWHAVSDAANDLRVLEAKNK